MLESIRGQVYHIMEEGRPLSPWGYAFDLALILLIALNVAATMAETVEPIYARYGYYFDLFEAVSIGLFTLEYLARVWVSVDDPDVADNVSPFRARLRYLFSPLALIDMVAIAPYYLSLFVALDLRVLRVLRLLRLFKLTRYWTALNLMSRVIRDEAQIIGAALFLLLVIVVLASGAMYLAEHRAQPEAFGSVPETMWWTVTTLTTVGYGDVVPTTPLGKLLGGFISLIGIGMVAFPSGILAAGFAEQIRRGRREYRERVDAALAKGAIDEQAAEELEDTREELGLSEAAVSDIELAELKKARTVHRCPHCGETLPVP
jgi:voltage-gated potassium channel